MQINNATNALFPLAAAKSGSADFSNSGAHLARSAGRLPDPASLPRPIEPKTWDSLHPNEPVTSLNAAAGDYLPVDIIA